MSIQNIIEAAEQWRPPQRLREEVLAEIEQELGLETPNETVRSRLADLVFEYKLGDEACKASRRIETTVRKRLKAAKKPTTKLLSILNEEPENEGPEGETDASIPVELAYLEYQSDVSFPGAAGHKNKPDLVDLSEKLERLCAFIDNYKGKGGRPRSEAWNVLMMELGVLYEDVTGKKPTVTENEHCAEAGERYSGAFVRLATLVDGAIAELCGVKPRPNSALGPALRRLLTR